MSVINYNPWLEAGQYGQAMAQTLGQILLTIPQIRAQQAHQQWQMQQQEQDAPFKQAYLQSQTSRNLSLGKEDEARGRYYDALPGIKQAATDVQGDKVDAMAQHQAAVDALAQALAPFKQQLLQSQSGTADARAGYLQQLPDIKYDQMDNKRQLSDVKNKAAIMMHEQTMKSAARLQSERAKREGMQKQQLVPRTGFQNGGVFNPYTGQFSLIPGLDPSTQPTNQPPSFMLQQHTNTPAPSFMQHLMQMLGDGATQPQAQMPMSQQGGRQLTPDIATQFLQQAGGDKEAARALARQAGYDF